MLKSQKKIELREVPATHEALFVEVYGELRRQAMHLTEHDPDLAADLLHDAYVQFTLARPDLDAIENISGYLYVVMRNLHLSQMRRATRTHLRSMSAVEFDTVDVGLWASDPRDRLRLRDELGAVCRFACVRKESSKGGSLLILRFFHGYYPEEIARVLCSTRGGVYERLRRVRAEVKVYLESPEKLAFIDEPSAKLKHIHEAITHDTGDLRRDLQRQIFDSCCGEHADKKWMTDFYDKGKGDAMERDRLAHIVSCKACLEHVNSLLDLPPLANRYPVDTLGNDPGPDDRSGGGGGTGGSGGGPGGSHVFDSFAMRRDAHFFHEPQELCISVNGQLQGSQRVVSGRGELTLILDTGNVGFVEVFSEQGLRLLMLNVDPPPAGDGKQAAHVDLSSGRTVDANLNFSGPFPALQVMYNDPELSLELAVEHTDAADALSVPPAPLLPEEGWPKAGVVGAAGGDLTAETQRHRRTQNLFDGFKSWLEPARLTAGFAMLLIAALIWFKLGPTATVSAAELLQKSIDAETAKLANKDRVLHRTLDLEESKNGEVVSRRKIDVWQSAEKGITARRLYDEQGQLTAGDWRVEGGVQTIYQVGSPAKLQPLPVDGLKQVSFDNVWQLSVSAKEFVAMLGSDAEVEERANDYLIRYESRSGERADLSVPPAARGPREGIPSGVEVAGGSSQSPSGYGITRASIVLSRDDLHAIEFSFTLNNQNETREYRMVETTYELKPANAVAPNVFEPNVELMSEPGAVATGFPAAQPAAKTNTNTNTETANTNSAPAATMATAALEVEVIEALNNAGAFTGEQVDVSRSGDGKINVTALVETANRKAALLTALNNVKNNPAVRIRIETVAEAEARVKKQNKATTPNAQPGTVERFDAVEGTNPVYAELRKKFSDEEARRFVSRVLNRSGQARSHALAMKQLSGRFSQADLASLTTAERGRWLALVRGHAERFVSEAETLRRELQQFFPEAAGLSGGGGAIGSDTELQARARELYDASVAIDRSLNRSLALTVGASGGAPLGPAFWRQFAQAVRLARSLAAAK